MRKVKKLGEGYFGIVYLYNDLSKKYGVKLLAIKREKILPEMNIESYENSGEFKFYKIIEKMPPSQQKYFTRLFDYKIISCKGNIGKRDLRGLSREELKKIKLKTAKLNKSAHCLSTTMDYSGTPIRNKKLTKKDLSQILRIINIAHDYHFILRDVWRDNLCILNGQIKLIDYGKIKKVILRGKVKGKDQRHRNLYNQNKDIFSFLFICINYEIIIDKIIKTQPPEKIVPYVMSHIFDSKQYPNIIKYMTKIYHNSSTKRKILNMMNNKTLKMDDEIFHVLNYLQMF